MKKIIILLLLIPIFVFPKSSPLNDPEKGCTLAVDNMIKILNQSEDEKYDKFKVEIEKMRGKIIKECIKESTYEERKCVYHAKTFEDALKCDKKSKPVKIEKKVEDKGEKVINKDGVEKECELVITHMINVLENTDNGQYKDLSKQLIEQLIKKRETITKECMKDTNSKERHCILNSKTFEDIMKCEDKNKKKGKTKKLDTKEAK